MMYFKALRERFMKTATDDEGQIKPLRAKKQVLDLAIIGGRGYHSSYGGVENAIRCVSDQLSSKYSIRIIVYGADSSERCEDKYANSAHAFFYAPKFVYRYFGQHGATLCCVLHTLLVSRPKVVLIFASGPSVFVPLFRLFGKPVVTSLRAIDSARDKWGKVSRKILQAGEYFAWRYSSSFTVNSKEMLTVFKNKRSDVLFVPNGSMAAKDADSPIREKFALERNGYFLFAARLDPVKRLHLLLEAHANLPAEYRLPLVVAGGHSKSEKYQKELMQYESDDVIFLGHLTAEELDPLMVNCRAFLLPSVLEGMSNSLLTAMATGCAVLASDIPPNSDVLLNQDAIFPVDDVEAMSSGLLRLSKDSEFADQLGKTLLAHVNHHYSWERTADLFYSQISKYLEPEHKND